MHLGQPRMHFIFLAIICHRLIVGLVYLNFQKPAYASYHCYLWNTSAFPLDSKIQTQRFYLLYHCFVTSWSCRRNGYFKSRRLHSNWFGKDPR